MQKWRPEYPVPLWHYVWLCAIMALARFLILRGNGPFFAISSWRIKFSFLDVLDCQDFEDKIFSRKIRDFEENFSSRMNEILKRISLSLLEWMRFCKQILFLFSKFKILRGKKSLFRLDSSLNLSSNSREKSYFFVWVDFD